MLTFLVWVIACVVTFAVFPLLGIGLFICGLLYMLAVDAKKTWIHLSGFFKGPGR